MYEASLIVRALRENATLSITGLEMVTCPVESCSIPPERCGKGREQSCKKRVGVVYEHDGHNKAVNLIFYYQHKEIPREGFIKKNDLALGILRKRGVINL